MTYLRLHLCFVFLLTWGMVVRGESREEYEVRREMLMEELGPAGALEGILASRVVDLTWRPRRAGWDRNEVFGALYDRYVARQGLACVATAHEAGGDAHPTGEAEGFWASDRGPEAGSDGGTALGGEGVATLDRGPEAWAARGQDARDTEGGTPSTRGYFCV